MDWIAINIVALLHHYPLFSIAWLCVYIMITDMYVFYGDKESMNELCIKKNPLERGY